MAALGKQVEIFSTAADSFAYQVFTRDVTLGGIDDVDANVEDIIEKLFGGRKRNPGVTDFRAAESEDTDVHFGVAELTCFHGSPDNCGCEDVRTGNLASRAVVQS